MIDCKYPDNPVESVQENAEGFSHSTWVYFMISFMPLKKCSFSMLFKAFFFDGFSTFFSSRFGLNGTCAALCDSR